jgi:hypothetical protein
MHYRASIDALICLDLASTLPLDEADAPRPSHAKSSQAYKEALRLQGANLRTYTTQMACSGITLFYKNVRRSRYPRQPR